MTWLRALFGLHLVKGDRIAPVDQQTLLSREFVKSLQDAYRNGDRVTITLKRKGKTFPVGVNIAANKNGEVLEYLANWAAGVKLREDGSSDLFCNPLDLL